MMQGFIALLSGLIFGVGLMLSGMTNPKKVQGFLDLLGNWDPSLAFVMVGGIGVSGLFYQYIKRRERSLLDCPLEIPTNKVIDRSLIIGATLFGVGWGLGGLCPGPALASLATGSIDIVVFVLAMMIGMIIYDFIFKKV